MSEPSPLSGEWTELLMALLDGNLTGAKRQRLAEWLRHDEQARAYYLEYVFTHALLRWELGDRLPLRGVGPAGGGVELPEPAEVIAPPVRLRARGLRRRWPRRLLAAAVLLVAVGLVGVLLVPRGPRPVPAAPVAVLVDSRDAVWENDQILPTEAGAQLPPGRLKLKAGVARVRFQSGAVVRLEGPADFGLVTVNRGALARGRLTARAPEQARGFTVAAPGAVVRDLGTEFGMRVDETGSTEVLVFAGQVEAALGGAGGPASPPVRLTRDSAVRLDPTGRTIRKVPFDAEAFARLRPPVAAPVTPVDLSAGFSRVGIVNDGTRFSGTKFSGGLDGTGYAYSAELLGRSLTAGGYPFRLGGAGSRNAVGARGRPLALPAGRYGTLAFLATAVNGDQTDQPFTVHYADGTRDKFTRSFSDWRASRDYPGETTAATMTYRNKNDGTRDNQACYLYLYRFPLNRDKTVSRVTPPNNPCIAILAIDLIR
jgi:hypothetical protein